MGSMPKRKTRNELQASWDSLELFHHLQQGRLVAPSAAPKRSSDNSSSITPAEPKRSSDVTDVVPPAEPKQASAAEAALKQSASSSSVLSTAAVASLNSSALNRSPAIVPNVPVLLSPDVPAAASSLNQLNSDVLSSNLNEAGSSPSFPQMPSGRVLTLHILVRLDF